MTDEDLKPPSTSRGEDGEKKVQEPPHQLKGERERICGRWRKKGYKPSKKEVAAYEARCKQKGLDPKTGKPKAKKK